MTAPKPHDPRQLQTTPEQLEESLVGILREEPDDLAGEVEQLERAHEVLRRALQDN